MRSGTARVLQWLVGVALVALFFVFADTSELGRLSRVSWPWLLGVLLSTVGLVLSSAGRWRMIAVRLAGGGARSLAAYAYYFVVGRALGCVLPAEITDVGVRTIALTRSEKFSVAGAAYTVLVDRLFDLVVLVCLVVPALVHLSGHLSQGAALALAAGGIVGVPLLVGARHGAVTDGLTHLFVRGVRFLRFLPGVPGLAAPELRAGAALGTRGSGAVYGLSVAKGLMVVARFYCVARAVDVAMPVATAFLCVPLAQVAALVAVTPGGLGILEAGWYGILVWAGLGAEETVLLVVAWRLYTFASLVCLALGLRIAGAGGGRRGERVQRK